MELAPLRGRGGRQFIGAYGGGGFRVSGARYTGSVLVFPERTMAWPVRGMAELDARSLDPVGAAAEALDLVLVG
ncbi:MAG: Mth938-like domain-containing protein, partial [Alphaproteobacteria bacterium]